MNRRRHELVISVYSNTRGFAFAVFEGPLAPLDWGMVEMRGKGKNRLTLSRVDALLDHYRPETAVLQDVSGGGTRRAARIERLNEALAALAESKGARVAFYSREQVREQFAGEAFATKQRIAEAIASRIPTFAHLLPPPRKPWHSEHPRMGLFDAASLVLTFYQQQANRNTAQQH